jgi:hypothetical protein
MHGVIYSILRVMIVVTWASFLLATLIYAFKFPWYKSTIGKWVVAMGSALAVSMSLQVLALFWKAFIRWRYVDLVTLVAWAGLMFTAVLFLSTVCYILARHRDVSGS